MDLSSVLMLLGGIGLFLYGMNILSSSLERFAGAGLERTLEKLTNNKFKGVLLGTVVTGIIQSSSATIVMIIGLLNAGIMRLPQAVSVMLGANIGTTVTAQILRLGDISGDSIIFTLLKPSSFAPICIAIGAAIMLVSKRQRTKDKASILLGFGVLFIGISIMESNLAPLRESEAFYRLFLTFENPLLGVLVGMAVTMVLQSSSASVGVLQALTTTGAVTFSMAAPIVIGQNIGKVGPVLLASIGANKKAKRAVCIDVMVNLMGAIIFLVGVYGFQYLVGFSFWDTAMTRGNVADFHSLFNIVTSAIMLPLSNKLISISGSLIKDEGSSKIDEELKLLDNNFLNTPTLALEQCKKVIVSMSEAVIENYDISEKLLEQMDNKLMAELQENERFLDRTETVLGDYLVKITERTISTPDSRLATEIMHSVSDFERIGDYTVNLAEVAEYNAGQNITFSENGKFELKFIYEAVRKVVQITADGYRLEDINLLYKVDPLEETIDDLVDMLKARHIDRLKNGTCNTQAGISFVELLTNLERISDHCLNISLHTIQRIKGSDSYNTHKAARDTESEEYKSLRAHYDSLYIMPISDTSN